MQMQATENLPRTTQVILENTSDYIQPPTILAILITLTCPSFLNLQQGKHKLSISALSAQNQQ
jgi:hypothetical protein